jgi:carboxyl-terminal processing protease
MQTSTPVKYRQNLIVGILIGLCFITAFFTGYLAREIVYRLQDRTPILHQALQLLEDHSLNPLPTPPAIEYGMIRGMVQAANDPYTMFVEPPQHQLETNRLEGKYGGIGVRVERDANRNYLLYPVPDSPALKAGIQDGDRLVSVGDLQVTPDTDQDKVSAAVRGPVGQKVTLVVARPPDDRQITFSIPRAELSLPSLTWNLVPDNPRVGIVHITNIAATTPAELEKAIDDLLSRKAGYLILDLRNNGGGLVDGGVDVARMFLKDGIVIQQQYRGEAVMTYNVEKPGKYLDLPLAVLINQGTASAAEIVAGALQGRGRASLVGAPSYGKGTIQLVFDLKDGSSLHVTTGRWWVPNDPVPLKPDIPQADDPNSNILVQTAIKELIK